MTTVKETAGRQPWKEIEDEIQGADVAALEETFALLTASDTARAISRLSPHDQQRLLQMLPAEEAADVLEDIPDAQAADMIGQLPTNAAAAIVVELPSDRAADVLSEMERETSESILRELPAEEQAEARELLSYDENTAGGIMIKEYLVYEQGLVVADVLRDLGEHAAAYVDFNVQYSYIVDGDGRLTGVLRLRDLVLAHRQATVASVMIENPISVKTDAPLAELHDFFEDHAFIGLPVVDDLGLLHGVILRTAVLLAESRVADETYLESTGIVGGEEFRSMGFLRRSGRRLSWLTINIALNVVAASVIAVYQETLSAVIVLAVFLPIISDMSGCSGNQAVAVSIRELSLGVIRPRDVMRVVWKEGIIGLMNGFVLGLLLGIVAWLWQDNLVLGLVVGGALAANTLVAVILGGAVPLVLRGLKQDPALASGPILTTVTDMCGFFLVLSLAGAYLVQLNG